MFPYEEILTSDQLKSPQPTLHLVGLVGWSGGFTFTAVVYNQLSEFPLNHVRSGS